MKHSAWLLGLLLVFFQQLQAQHGRLLPYVQPMSGTAASTTLAATKHSEARSEQFANTIPAVAPPFAMTQWTPQTQQTEQKCLAPYYYSDTILNGFRASHWLSGSCTQDYGSFTVMPVSGSLSSALTDPTSPFAHDKERSSPAYYRVMLDRFDLQVEMTGTARCGMMRITALKSDSVYLLVQANSDVQQGVLTLQSETEVVGKNPVHRIYQGQGDYAGFDGHLYLHTQRKAGSMGVYNKYMVSTQMQAKGNHTTGVYLGFFLQAGEQLQIKMGTSFIGADGAMKNLQREIPAWDFDAIKQQTEHVWESALGKIQIQTSDTGRKQIFYTALYHAMQHPRLFNDVDGRYPRFAANQINDTVGNSDYYDDFSMWDIYRAQLPLLEILDPQRVTYMVASLLTKGEQGGWLPIFPCWNNYTAAMIGDHAAVAISSAYLKGISTAKPERAYQLMRKNAFVVANSADYLQGKGRRALASYLQYGYIPLEDGVPDAFHKNEQVSRTLEYAYDDYALGLFAKHLGKMLDYATLMKRARNYQHVFDKQVGMVRGRYQDGSWYEPFRPEQRELYITEGTPHQYTFYVPQDIPGLTKLMGGKQALERSLDSLFAHGGYWHGNEPGHQIPFLYNYTASPWKTQRVVRRILEEEYSNGSGGLAGNDDAGQMSAWYVFAALGFYPVDPVSGAYLLTTPAYSSYEIRLSDQVSWKVRCDHDPQAYPYIHALQLNGKPLKRNYLTYHEIMQGGELMFQLKREP